ncbi:MAG: octacis-undecaprenol 4-epimerase [Candidatus Ordinivivax streblomastigis]|uniref:Octacis-undecaprenol 4-epimerase n=1 Tax=Candidatus Ordinivivax streblomastigis TaxID=2540710 RepID=A0A5M8P620_9BACT|nr:MAG: octacis-undecaprenol 4-epimerase [Candidatus Ordinivivax streblomastigis]
MTLLITGIHGFVGSNLVAALHADHSIYGLDIVSPEKEGIIKTFCWDELAQIPEVDTIIHLAGKAHDTKNKSLAQTYFDINTGLTQTIFDYFLQSKAKQFLFFSSVKAAVDSVEGDVLTEDVIPQPVGPYGESKIRAEEYIQSTLLSLSGGEGVGERSVYILRPCMIHGPGNKGNLNLLYQVVSKGIPWPLGAFENQRSFMNIWNLSYIIEQFILKNPASGIYHLADDEPLSTNELIELIAASRKKKGRIWKINRSLIAGIAQLGSICKFPLNTERLHKLTENYVVSNQKMKTALDITRLPVDVRTGLQQTLKTFK